MAKVFIKKPQRFRSRKRKLSGRKMITARRSAPDYITTETLPEVRVFKPCQRKAPKGGWGPRGPRLRKNCHVELVIVGESLSRRFNVKPGTYLQACTKYETPGIMIPVRDHRDALEVSRKICECGRRGGRNARRRCAMTQLKERG